MELWDGKALSPQSLTNHCGILENKNAENNADKGGVAWEEICDQAHSGDVFKRNLQFCLAVAEELSMMSVRPETLKYSLSFNREVDTGKLGLRNNLVLRPASLRRTFWEYFLRLSKPSCDSEWPGLHLTLMEES